MRLIKIFSLTLAAAAFAEPDWHERKLEGWYYFQDESSPEETATYASEEAAAILDEEKRQLHETLSMALLAPTQENIAAYLAQSQRQIERSSQFAKACGEHIRPTGNSRIQEMAKTHFLLFCFKGNDPGALQSSQTARAFAADYGWQFKAVCLDGNGPEGLECETDRGIAARLKIRTTPAYFAVDPILNHALFLGDGNLSPEDLTQRINGESDA